MKAKQMKSIGCILLFGLIGFSTRETIAQGTIPLQNLDFEDGTFVPIAGHTDAGVHLDTVLKI